MVDDKKPKIDLKARLGKTGMVPPAAASGAIPGPPNSVPGSPVSIPAPMQSGSIPGPALGSTPPPMMGGLGGQFRPAPSAAPAMMMAAPAPPQPQRIEMDESTLEDARKGAFKKALAAGAVLSVMVGAVGYVAGGALEKSNGRAIAREDAKALEADVVKSKATMETILKLTEDAKATLAKGEFPDAVAKDLGGITIDFDGQKLGMRRFSGFKVETTQKLVAYVTAVQETNNNKGAILRALTRLEKPMKEQIAAKDKTSIGYVVIVGTKDPSGNVAALLAPLEVPLQVAKTKIDLPAEFSFIDPASSTRGKAKLERYKSGNLDKPSALYVSPGSIERAFPSERSTISGQLIVKLTEMITSIKGEAKVPDMVTDPKPGMMERADKLIDGLKAAYKD
jgi:hypothetical protein